MKKFIVYTDPLQFEGAGGAGGTGTGAAAGAAGDGGNSQGSSAETIGAGTEGAENGASAPAQTGEEEDLLKLLKDKPNLRKQYDEQVAKAIKSRFKDENALKSRISQYENTLGLLREAFPDAPQDADPAKMDEYLQGKSELWSQAAADAGMSVEAYKQMKELERTNQKLLGEQRAAQEEAQRTEMFQRWDAEAEQVKQVYPNFDQYAEANNPATGEQFVKLLGYGVPMKQAYETIHVNELLEQARAGAATEASQQTAQAIRQGQGRPLENGATRQSGTKATEDPSKFTHDDLVKIRQRARAGEVITFK